MTTIQQHLGTLIEHATALRPHVREEGLQRFNLARAALEGASRLSVELDGKAAADAAALSKAAADLAGLAEAYKNCQKDLAAALDELAKLRG